MISVECRYKRFAYSLTVTDECDASISVCDVNAHCQNSLGSYRCTCKAGFSGDGHTCKGGRRFYQKTYSSHTAIVVARCYFSELSSTITSLDLKLLRVNNLFFN